MYLLEHILSGLEFIKTERRSAMNSLSLLVVTAFNDEKKSPDEEAKKKERKDTQSLKENGLTKS